MIRREMDHFLSAQQGELDAASDYAPFILEYPQIEPVLKDEIRHGDKMKELSAKYF